MTWNSAFFGLSEKEKQQQQFCQQAFPTLFGSFVNAFVDFGFNGSAAAPDQTTAETVVPTFEPGAERLIAIGDLHGDFKKAWRAFRLSGLIDERGRWSGGDSVCVQVGDILDRGDQEIQIFYFMERLQLEAAAAGGRMYILNGNHETMNVASNHRYATAGASIELTRWKQWQALAGRLRERYGGGASSRVPPLRPRAGLGAAAATSSDPISGMYGSLHFERTAAMQPGAELTRRFMSSHSTVLQVGSNLFVHGGVLPAHVEYGLERINRETQSWLLQGQALKPPNFLRGSTAIVWARDYSTEDESKCDCPKLQQVLQSIPGAQRMVVGHTIQAQGVNSACDGRVYRVDVGLSRGCGDGQPQVLEILGDSRVRRLSESLPPLDLQGTKVAADSSSAGGGVGGARSSAAGSWEGMWGRLSGGLFKPSQAA